MNTETVQLSDAFQQLYCDARIFDSFSTLHPISFRRVLPFQASDVVLDDMHLLFAEEAFRTDRNENTRRSVIDAYLRCGLLSQEDAANLKSVTDDFDAEFFELMGLAYANAGMFICALRWYRELIAELESGLVNPRSGVDGESVYASVGYCLYSLGLFEEAISWSKSCIGSRPMVDAACEALINYEATTAGGTLLAVERSANRARYTVSARDLDRANQSTARLTAAMKSVAPFRQEIYIDWVGNAPPVFQRSLEGYPFGITREAGSLPRHKMNLICATCAIADILVGKGSIGAAQQLLFEAAMVEPRADVVRDRIKGLP